MSKFLAVSLWFIFIGFALAEVGLGESRKSRQLNKLFHNPSTLTFEPHDADIKRELIKKAQDTSETLEVRSAAIFALRDYLEADSNVRKILRDLAERDSHWAIRAVSFRSLARTLWDAEMTDFLKERAEREYDLSVKIEIYRAFARARNNKEVYRFLLDCLGSNYDLRIKVAIVKSLFSAVGENDQEAIEALKHLLRDPNPPLREAAIKILSQDCHYFVAWICPENPNSSCRYNDPFQPPVYCP